MENDKRLLVLSDLPVLGRVALAAAYSAVESLGVQMCALPTALLSTHGGYSGAVCIPQTEFLKKTLIHLESLNLSFQGLLTGFVATLDQFPLLELLARDLGAGGALVVVDPIMGDNGRYYGLFNKDFLPGMLALVSHAQVITPNLTEAALLLSIPYEELQSHKKSPREAVMELSELGPELVIMTSLPNPLDPTTVGICAFHRPTGEFVTRFYPLQKVNFPGTGDLFTALLTAHLIQGKNWQVALELAGNQTDQAIRRSLIPGRDPLKGLVL